MWWTGGHRANEKKKDPNSRRQGEEAERHRKGDSQLLGEFSLRHSDLSLTKVDCELLF
jgi:hypothetical protein